MRPRSTSPTPRPACPARTAPPGPPAQRWSRSRRPPGRTLLLALLAALAPGEGSRGENWAGWRGPGGVGVSPEKDVPRFGAGDHRCWSWADPGLGHSSPIVWEDAVFVTTAIGEARVLVRIDARSGREVWRRRVVVAPREGKHRKNSYASATPATDGERVYVSFLAAEHRIVVAAYDFSGRLVWRVSPGEFHSMHGFCSTPVLFESLVLLNADQDAWAYLVAFDRRTGRIRWKTHRENDVRSYCPPTVFQIEGEPQMVLSGSKTVASYDPRTGRRNWVCDGPTEQCVASLVYGEGLVFVTGGYPDRKFLAIDPRGRGDITTTHIRWRARRGVAYVPSPLYLDGRFWVVSDRGTLSVLEARTGKYLAQKTLPGDYSASLLFADGHVYACSESGDVTVLEATPKLKVVASWKAAAPIYATPAVSEGTLLIRTWEKLYAFRRAGRSDLGS